MSKKPRREENGFYFDEARHWEMWEAKAYIYAYQTTTICRVTIPIDIVRHLKLKNHDKIMVAIRKKLLVGEQK